MDIQEYARCQLPTQYGEFEVRVFRNDQNDLESVTIGMGTDFSRDEEVFVRVHSECFTGEVLGSLKCDCKPQLELAMHHIAEEGRGVIVYLRQEGRGIGLGNKIRAYAEQAKGLDTIEANHVLGFPADMRDFSVAALILRELGIQQIHLNTNNPQKKSALEEYDLQVNQMLPSLTAPNEFNEAYLQTKAYEMGHESLSKVLSRVI